jgi:site-specific DNA recombinase
MLSTPDEWLLYLRKSVGYTGIGRQRTATTDYLAGMGGRVAGDGEFSDADKTAYRDILAPAPPRPGFDGLLAEMARRPGIGVAAWHADRLGRDPEAGETLARACARGRHLIATRAGGIYDVTTANGLKHWRDDINAAAHEVGHNTERVLEAMAEIRAQGRWGGGRVPFGWRLDRAAVDGDGEPLKGVLILDEAEAALIREAAVDVLGGLSLYAVARRWNEAGAAGRRWTHVTVRQVLTRPLNASLLALGGTVIGEGGWPAILGKDAHRAICSYLSSPSRRVTTGPARRHLLSGIAVCGACGAPLAIGGTGSRKQYRCRPHSRGLAAGSHAGRLAARLDEFAAALAKGRLKREDAALLLRADHGEQRRALLAREVELQADHDALWPMWRRKVITDAELTSGRAEVTADLERVRARLAELDQADVLAPMLADPEAAWERADISVKRAVVAALMYITVFPSRQGRPAGIPRGEPWFDVDSIDVRWVRRLPSDG